MSTGLRDLLVYLDERERIYRWLGANPAPPPMSLSEYSTRQNALALNCCWEGRITSEEQAAAHRAYVLLQDQSESQFHGPLTANRFRVLVNRVATTHRSTLEAMLDMPVHEFERLYDA